MPGADHALKTVRVPPAVLSTCCQWHVHLLLTGGGGAPPRLSLDRRGCRLPSRDADFVDDRRDHCRCRFCCVDSDSPRLCAATAASCGALESLVRLGKSVGAVVARGRTDATCRGLRPPCGQGSTCARPVPRLQQTLLIASGQRCGPALALVPVLALLLQRTSLPPRRRPSSCAVRLPRLRASTRASVGGKACGGCRTRDGAPHSSRP